MSPGHGFGSWGDPNPPMGWGGLGDPLCIRGDATPTQPLRPQVRPPDEPESGSNPIEGEGFELAQLLLRVSAPISHCGCAAEEEDSGYGLGDPKSFAPFLLLRAFA